MTASPFCRTKETAVLAFEYAEAENYLASSANMKKNERDRAAKNLLKLLKLSPQEGTNSVIIGHSANIREATGDWPKPEGTILMYSFIAEKKLKLIARIGPDEWTQFTNE